MKKNKHLVKQPSVAGAFYPADKEEILMKLQDYAADARKDYNITSRAVIVPHAGWEYSGLLAYEGLQYLDDSVKNVFIFAPAHRTRVEKTAISSFDAWETPLGHVNVNQEINKVLEEKFGAQVMDEAFDEEHAIEVQLPFLQERLSDFNIIPILVGGETPAVIQDIIEVFYSVEDTAFVISSDLSHFHNSGQAIQLDKITARMIESNIGGYAYEQACGVIGIYGLTAFAANQKYSLVRVGMYNSGKATNDYSRVVGYGSWVLYEGEKNQFLKEKFGDYALELCKRSIKTGLEQKCRLSLTELEYIPEVFREEGACFVTLHIDGKLRGCIGSIIAHMSLIEDLLINSYNAAFADPRFCALSEEEFEKISIDISFLSTPSPIKFESEDDLLNQMIPNEDGIIIKEGPYQAVYLPSVWEDLPDKTEFLNSLKMKAGMPPDYFSQTFEAYRFKTTCVE